MGTFFYVFLGTFWERFGNVKLLAGVFDHSIALFDATQPEEFQLIEIS